MIYFRMLPQKKWPRRRSYVVTVRRASIDWVQKDFCIHMYPEVFFTGFCKQDLGAGKATTGSCLALGHCFWKRGRFCVRPKGWNCLDFCGMPY